MLAARWAKEHADNRPVFTANMNINYRKPLPGGTRLALETSIDQVQGRKLYISAQVGRVHIREKLGAENTGLKLLAFRSLLIVMATGNGRKLALLYFRRGNCTVCCTTSIRRIISDSIKLYFSVSNFTLYVVQQP